MSGEITELTITKGNEVVAKFKGKLEPVKEESPAPKFKVGDKVVPVSKSVGVNWNDWQKDGDYVHKFFKKHGFLCVKKIAERIELNDGSRYFGDYFLESDLRPYVEPKAEKEAELRGFKVGDRVKIKSAKELAEFTHKEIIGGWNRDMIKYAGQIQKIINTRKDRLGNGFYFENVPFVWDKRLLEPVPSNLCPTPRTEKYIFNGPATICIIEQDGKQYKGVAKCYYKDTWDEQIGREEARKKASEQINR